MKQRFYLYKRGDRYYMQDARTGKQQALANYALFGLAAPSENDAWEKAEEQGKSDFALNYAIKQTTWNVPRYIAEGLRWLAQLRSAPESQATVAQSGGTAPTAAIQPPQASNG